MRKYTCLNGTIEFSEGLNMPLADFIEAYSGTFPFCYIPRSKKEEELKKAYKIATDGNIKPSIKKQPKTNTEKDRGAIIQIDKKDRKKADTDKSEADI